MLITSTRDPSQQTRTLCKLLARLFQAEYINRGKASTREIFARAIEKGHKQVLIVGSFYGSPGSLAFYDAMGNCLLSLHIAISKVTKERFFPRELILVGEGKLAQRFSQILGLELNGIKEGKRMLIIEDKALSFYEGEVEDQRLLLKLKIFSIKYEGKNILGIRL
jgi:U3 small nucleolar ribonucleoprotein protein IMP4